MIGNHTMNHKNLTKLSESEVLQQIDACADIVENASGVRPYLLRCPGGNVNDAVKKVLKDQHLALVNWSVDTRDWQSRNTEKVLETAFQSGNYGIRDGAIVLMHDVYETTLNAAVRMMDRLIADGYTIVTVPELLAARNEVVYAGVRITRDFNRIGSAPCDAALLLMRLVDLSGGRSHWPGSYIRIPLSRRHYCGIPQSREFKYTRRINLARNKGSGLRATPSAMLDYNTYSDLDEV